MATMISNQTPPNWQWMPGMAAYRVYPGDRMNGESADDVVRYRILKAWVATEEDADSSYGELDAGQTYLDVMLEDGEETYISTKGLIPDFNDPATLGCLRSLAADLCGGANFHVSAFHTFSGTAWCAWVELEKGFARIGAPVKSYLEALLGVLNEHNPGNGLDL